MINLITKSIQNYQFIHLIYSKFINLITLFVEKKVIQLFNRQKLFISSLNLFKIIDLITLIVEKNVI